MRASRTHWTRADDLALITCIFSGYTEEGVAAQMGMSRGQFSNRLRKLGLGFSGARKAKREGMTPDQYLDTSPLYQAPPCSRFATGIAAG